MQCKTLLNYIKYNFTIEVLLFLVGVAQWIEHGLRTMLPIRFPVRAHASVVGQVPSGGQESTH